MVGARKIGDNASPKRIHLALDAIPGIAVVITAALMMSGVAGRTMSARVFGGPPAQDGHVAWRFVALVRSRGVYSPLQKIPLEVSARLGTQVHVVRAVTDDEGAIEVRVPTGSTHEGTIPVAVTDGSGRPILHADLPIVPRGWSESFSEISPNVRGKSEGAIKLSFSLMRGALAVPFDEDAIVSASVAASGTPLAEASVSFEGDGLVVEPSHPLRTDSQGICSVRVHAQEHVSRLSIVARSADGLEGSWHGAIPISAGAMWVDPHAARAGTVRVLSPVQHRTAYLTFFRRHARILALRIPLVPDAQGGAVGILAMPKLQDDLLWILPSPDPPGQGQEETSVGWPVRLHPTTIASEPAPAATIRTPLLYDGMPAALRASRAQASTARFRVTIVLAFASLLETALLFIRARQAKLELSRMLRSQADLGDAIAQTFASGERFWLKMFAAAFTVTFGFCLLALVAWLGPP